ncbi:MAG TPA: aminotransferase class V-fold PLP-dependent enzyme [Planctomycetota bacterium]|nr:aminotransferase class V-fold PLP-dependent enzyme [Planctomycetota bacterium]
MKPEAFETVFCDFNAGAPASEEVLAAFLEAERTHPGNPASVHATGRKARAALEEARARIGTALGVAAADVVFTSGGTEAANLAVAGLGDPALPVVVSDAEHPAVNEPALVRGTQTWSVDQDGAAVVQPPAVPVGLLCLVHAQSELGTLQPVLAAKALADRLGVPLFVDAAQSLGRTTLSPVLATGAILALSPHKCGDLRGHGVLLGRDLQHRLRPLLRGGGQELGLRPGTQSPALALANALAIERAVREQPQRALRMEAARHAFLNGLSDTVEHRVLTPLANSVPNTAMLYFPDVDGRNLLPALDLAGIHASHGAACSSGSPTPPRILAAIGLRGAAARACVRFSFGWRVDTTSWRDVGARVGAIVSRLKKN